MAQFVCSDSSDTVRETLDQLLDGIKADQEEMAEITKRVKARKVAAKAAIKAKGVRKYEAASGVSGVFYDTSRTNADKATAADRRDDPDCGIDAEDYAAIFKVSTVENFKVK